MMEHSETGEKACRRRARYLHEDIEQQITALARDLEARQHRITVSPGARIGIRHVSLRLRQLSREMQQLSQHLHPQISQ